MLRLTTLVQRLNTPQPGKHLRSYGLIKEVQEILSPIFSIDYMGDANFELGAIPQTLQKIADQSAENKIIAQTYTATVQPNEFEINMRNYQQADVTFYMLGTQETMERAKQTIDSEALAEAAKNENVQLHESSKLHETLSPKEIKTEGWLELNNGFMFFSNYDMFAKTAELFQVEHDIAPPKQNVLGVV